MMESIARRMYQLVTPIHEIAYFADEPTEEQMALGHRGYWDGYFAGRAAPLGDAPAEVVHAVFYNFAPGEVARHIPRVWKTASREAALAARERGCTTALRRILGGDADLAAIERAAELATKAAFSAPIEGRALYAGLRTVPVPTEPMAKLWHAATLLREHRGDGHNVALVAAGIGGTEAHVLHALSAGQPAEEFGRVSHLPAAQLAAVIDGMRTRGIVDESGWLTDLGKQIKRDIETQTDILAAPAYTILTDTELDQLTTDLAPIAKATHDENPFI
jgi:hypothetical protein